ncbi:MAG: GAF domain-containing protein [Lachnospiraceae bacterium]|nr:GAF domain-containing protein [Lachnospiraceae bacterium]
MVSLASEVKAVIEDVPYLSANLSNVSAVIYSHYDKLNWAGFYLMKEGKLVLNSFQGKVACTEIKIGKGVCGTAVEKDETLVVDDVHKFPTHIACDSASNSEIVIPIHLNGEVFGVLDIDSVSFARFSVTEKEELEEAVKVIEEYLPSMR